METLCWWCHWGWPKPIRDIYDKALQLLGGDSMPLKFGPAHIVWEDENFESAQWCLDHFEEHSSDKYTRDELEVVRQSLVELIAVPDKFKDVPENYDGQNPELFPPPADWIMVK